MSTLHTPVQDRSHTDVLARVLPLAGVAFAALTAIGDLTIGPFPDGHSGMATLASFYSDRHEQLATGGMLMAWGTVALALFGAALWVRVRNSGASPALPVLVAIGTAMAGAAAATSAATYSLLGELSTDKNVAPEALQAWHLAGSELATYGGTIVLLLAVGTAGIASRAVPGWLAWPALVIALVQFTPMAFLGSLAFLLWCAATGVILAIRRDG